MSHTPNQAGAIADAAVDHFPGVLKHCNDRQLADLTRACLRRAAEGPESVWDNCLERAAACRAECRRRHLTGSPDTRSLLCATG